MTNLSTNIKSFYKSKILSIDLLIKKYFNQADTIELLEKENRLNNQYKLKYILQKNKQPISSDKNIALIYTNVLSYITLNDFSKVILDTNISINDGDIYALSTLTAQSAGIVVKENNITIAYLNPNPKSNYSVYIGKKHAPGITSGANGYGNIIIKHIPKWYKVNIGDKVITSGMDNIFKLGLEVGRIVSVKEARNTQVAFVKPATDVLNHKSFYIIKKDN